MKMFKIFYSLEFMLNLENLIFIVIVIINRRDCVSASVYYVQSGMEEYDHIINPPVINEDFEKFLNSLGWPVINEFLSSVLMKRNLIIHYFS